MVDWQLNRPVVFVGSEFSNTISPPGLVLYYRQSHTYIPRWPLVLTTQATLTLLWATVCRLQQTQTLYIITINKQSKFLNISSNLVDGEIDDAFKKREIEEHDCAACASCA